MHISLKIATAALVILAGTSAAFAKTAWVSDDTPVKEDPYHKADNAGWAHEGQKVDCTDFENGFCYAERKGADGWIDTDDLNFKKFKDVELCISGGSFGGGGIFIGGEFCVN